MTGHDAADGYLERAFGLEKPDLKRYSPLTLAYLGDAVYELVIRTVLVRRANAPVNRLNRKASDLAQAKRQSAIIRAILPDLTEKEAKIYLRGRNARSYTKAKNASTADYRRATGFEALIGYLYLKDQKQRMIDLIRTGIECTGSG